jgi:cobalt/nickel transport system permease protein
MHIPDGFLDVPTAATAAALAGVGVSIALRAVRRAAVPRRIPLIGLAAAFVFAAQMLNFPVGAGTSGHLVGAVLAAVLLGPAAAVVVMTAVLILQCLMFADGGLIALGANLLNMAVIAPTAGYLIYSALRRTGPVSLRRTLLAAGFAAWCSAVLASLACAVELALSGAANLRLVLPAMGGVHMLIGLGEAVITMLVIVVIARSRPELIESHATRPGSHPVPFVYGGSLLVGGLLLLVPFASPLPDGLERIADRLSFAEHATTLQAAPFPGYGLGELARSLPGLSALIAGLVGSMVAFALAWLVARALTSPRGLPGSR